MPGASSVAPGIAIVGCGAVGTAILSLIARHCARADVRPAEILVFDASPRIGPGLPYADDASTNLLNRTAIRMSLLLDEPADFLDWLKSHSDSPRLRGIKVEPDAFLPRALFGDYLAQRCDDAIASLRTLGCQVRVINEEVTTISGTADLWQLTTASGRGFASRSVALCTGHAPATNFVDLCASPGYIPTPYPTTALRRIPRDAEVAVLGSRLSAIDATLALVGSGHAGPIRMLSRNGLLPIVGHGGANHVLSARTMRVLEQCGRTGISWRQLWLTVLREMRRASAGKIRFRSMYGMRSGAPIEAFLSSVAEAETGSRGWQDAFGALLLHIGTLWSALSAPDRQRVRREFSQMEAVRVPTPLTNGKQIAELLRSGRLMLGSPLRHIAPSGSGFIAVVGGRQGDRVFRPDVVINCTGTGDHVGTEHGAGTHALYASLLRSSYARRHGWGGIDVDESTQAVIGADGHPTPGLFAVGAMTAGAFLVTSSLTVCLAQAGRAVPGIVEAAVAGRREVLATA